MVMPDQTASMPTLDAHAHLRIDRPPAELSRCGAVIALTLSLDEAEQALSRDDPLIAWGVGCYPGNLAALQAFDVARFRELAERAAVIGEVGLDAGRRPPLDLQLRVFRAVLEVAADLHRPVSIHGADLIRAGSAPGTSSASLVLDELRRTPIDAPILHWWTGSADETSRAVELGCTFSVHSQVARRSQFRTRVPPERILVETDHGYDDPPAAIPCRVEWVEHLMGQQLKMGQMDVRRLVWRNFGTIVQRTGTQQLLPKALAALVAALR